MSRKVILSGKFKRDLKKHYLELATFEWSEVLQALIRDEELPQKYSDHALKGNYQGCRDCHIKPDLVLIYEKINNDLLLIRLGTHSELF